MTKEEAIQELLSHLRICGSLMPLEWIEKYGEGSRFMEAYGMAIEALKGGEK